MSVKLLQASTLYMPEYAARNSHNSQDKMNTNPNFVKSLVDKGHVSILEHTVLTFEVECSIRCSRQLLRHRLLSVVERSTRYVDSSRFEYDIPKGLDSCQESVFINAMLTARDAYRELRRLSVSKDIAQAVLPLATITNLVLTANLRVWLDFISKRNTKEVHEEIRGIAEHMELLIKIQYPELY